MSVLIIGKFKGDTAKFQQALVDRADEFAKIAEGSKTVGGLHHRFGVGDGYVVIVDEWESVEQFQTFMADPDLQAFIGSVGGAPEPPEVIVAEAITSPDQF
jgi:quinol monooxygenase YgiN